MKEYSLSLSTYISSSTRIRVYEMERNGESIFKLFFEEIEKDTKLFKDLVKSIRIIENTSNLKRAPKTKFREIKGHGLACKVYEAKSNKIRVYLFHEKNTGRIIVAGGLKTRQKKDIKRVISIIKDYYYERDK